MDNQCLRVILECVCVTTDLFALRCKSLISRFLSRTSCSRNGNVNYRRNVVCWSVPCAALWNSSMSICGTRLFVGSRTALSTLMLNSLKLDIVYVRNEIFLKLLIVDLCYLRSSFSYFLLLFVSSNLSLSS